MIEKMKLIGAHFGLTWNLQPSTRSAGCTCITLSRAPHSAPLRNALHPPGLPKLSPLNQQRVNAVNSVYRHAVRFMPWKILHVVVMASTCNIVHTNTSAQNLLECYFCFHPVEFDFCVHGGSRAKSTKLTKLLVSTQQFKPLGIVCDKSHNHEPWTIVSGFDKWILLQRKLKIFHCSDRYAECASTMVAANALEYNSKFFRLQSLMAQSIQTKGHDQLVPEFSQIIVTTAKILARLGPGGDDSESSSEKLQVGSYFNHKDHLKRSLELQHPAFTHKSVPDDLKKAIFFVATHSMADVALFRISKHTLKSQSDWLLLKNWRKSKWTRTWRRCQG